VLSGHRRFAVTVVDECNNVVVSVPSAVDFPGLVIGPMTVDERGNLVFVEPLASRAYTLSVPIGGSSSLVPLFGTAAASALPFDGRNPLATRLDRPCAVQLDALGNLWVADTNSNRVRRAWVGAFLTGP
jgi:hypothetical protein